MRVLVTGAASGIGRATCLRLARDARAAGTKASRISDSPLNPGGTRGVSARSTFGSSDSRARLERAAVRPIHAYLATALTA